MVWTHRTLSPTRIPNRKVLFVSYKKDIHNWLLWTTRGGKLNFHPTTLILKHTGNLTKLVHQRITFKPHAKLTGFMVNSDHLEQNKFSYIKFITLGKLNLYTAGHRLISECIKLGYSKGIYQRILRFWFHHLEQTIYSGKLEAELHTACSEEKRQNTDTKTT